MTKRKVIVDDCMGSQECIIDEKDENQFIINEQVKPVANDGPDVWLLVLKDMEARRALGIEKYGMPVRPNNGRNALIDAYQEALDLVVYLRQAIEERKIKALEESNSPILVCLCGSTRFKKEFEDAEARLTDEGKIVLTVGRFGHKDGLDMESGHKKKLDQLHLRKIDKAHEIEVINVGGYVGESTCNEIVYARSKGKIIRYLEPDNICHAQRDGNCIWEMCPQNRDNEPAKSGRHCPLDYSEDTTC